MDGDGTHTSGPILSGELVFIQTPLQLWMRASFPSMAALNHYSSLLLSRPLPKSGHDQPRFCNLPGFRAHREHLLVKCDSAPQNLFPLLGESVSRAGVLVFIGTSLFFGDPAIAFKGGGPYGAGVTRGQDLTGKDFSGKSLIKQDFKTSILRQANFKGAELLGASFFDADLTGADLSDADLRGADLSLANMTKANLSNANLEGALATGNTSFRGSNITGADFTDVPLRDDQREYLCKAAEGVNPTTGNATRDTLFCN